MSGFRLITTPTSPSIREWFGTSGNDPGLPNNQASLLTNIDIAYGYEGDDTIDVGFSANSQVYGGQGNDRLIGSPVFLSINNLFGDRGNDTIIMKGGTGSFGSGGQGNDTLIGADGTIIDSLFGGQDNDVIRGYSGSDFLSGDVGADIIWGDESLSGNTGNADTILGGTDSDSIVGGGGDDSIHGGQGDDYLEVDASLVTSGTPPTSNFPSGDAGVVSGNDRVFGDLGDDTIGRLGSTDGATGTDYYDGGEGNDSIQGGNQGNSFLNASGLRENPVGDTLIGGNGNDTIRGGTEDSGRDSISGGAGDDSIIGGNEDGFANYNAASVQFGDVISGDAGNDNIDAQDGNDSVSGGTGNDSIQGAGGTDTLLGDDQNDFIVGGDGDDSIIGGRDQDILEGGAGSDTLTGFDGTNKGDGVDRFVYNLASILSGNNIVYNPSTAQATPPDPSVVTRYDNVPSAVTQASADYITVFDPTQDVIQINSLTNVTSTAGTVPVGQVPGTATGPFTATGTATTANFGGTPVNIGGATPPMVAIGSTYIIGAASGNVATPITTFDTTAANSLIYIERDGVAGFNGANDIALATVLGTRPTDLGAANFA